MSKTKKPLILVVDDLESNIQFLAMTLKKIDCRITAATNGEDAIKIAKKNNPALILLDIMMPGMSGMEVCRELKDNCTTKHIPVIFVTAKVGKDNIIAGLNMGAVDYITKPFIASELITRINNHLKYLENNAKILKLEIKNTILAMSVTANHEIRQPLSIIQMEIEMMKIKNDEFYLKNESRFSKIFSSLEKINSILKKHENFDDVIQEEYIPGTKMFNFDESEK